MSNQQTLKSYKYALLGAYILLTLIIYGCTKDPLQIQTQQAYHYLIDDERDNRSADPWRRPFGDRWN